MDYATVTLSQYIREKGIQISTISEKTGIPYGQLWPSLSPGGSRKLRADEFLQICGFINKNPMEFIRPDTASYSKAARMGGWEVREHGSRITAWPHG